MRIKKTQTSALDESIRPPPGQPHVHVHYVLEQQVNAGLTCLHAHLRVSQHVLDLDDQTHDEELVLCKKERLYVNLFYLYFVKNVFCNMCYRSIFCNVCPLYFLQKTRKISD